MSNKVISYGLIVDDEGAYHFVASGDANGISDYFATLKGPAYVKKITNTQKFYEPALEKIVSCFSKVTKVNITNLGNVDLILLPMNGEILQQYNTLADIL
jgi:hypothetical protein